MEDTQNQRQQVVDTLGALVAGGLTSGSSGNVSVRCAEGMLITPTGVVPQRLRAEHVVNMDLEGVASAGQLAPSSEWRIHADIYRHQPGVGAIVHCHSPYATILACARKPIPPIHYMLAAAGRHGIPLADYATFGTQALSDAVNRALSDSPACLMANHGQVATGKDLERALQLAQLIEEVAHWYWGVLAIGEPALLSAAQMDEALEAFAHYGQQETRRDLAPGARLDKD
jgi:L-fuculose-phosphate aldolase